MRYLFAILIVIPGILTLVLEGDATLLLFCFALSMYLIWSKTDWTKGPYRSKTTVCINPKCQSSTFKTTATISTIDNKTYYTNYSININEEDNYHEVY